MAQQTAVDWLVNKIYMVIPNEERNFLEGLREEALKKEKDHICNAYVEGLEGLYMGAEEYYEKTYNKNK